MTPCPSCNRHVHDEICPFCGAKCVQSTRSPIGRVARGALFAAGAVALTECSSVAPQPMYGASCVPLDACAVQDASTKSDASDDAGEDAASDAPADATID